MILYKPAVKGFRLYHICINKAVETNAAFMNVSHKRLNLFFTSEFPFNGASVLSVLLHQKNFPMKVIFPKAPHSILLKF